jgi:hypothetical protein
MNRRPGRASFENDDYSRFSGPDFHQDYHPGVSGKSRNTGSWFNEPEYQAQKNFIGKGPRGYQRQDARIYEDACEALTREPSVDASGIEVEVREGVIILSGSVPDRPTRRWAEACVEDLTGVLDVNNKLRIMPQDEAGTLGMIKNQSRLSS